MITLFNKKLWFNSKQWKSLFPKPTSSPEYAECDGIRGLAILSVIAFHYMEIFKIPDSLLSWLNPLYSFSFIGPFGVQLFFILSAYLLFLPQFKRLYHRQAIQPVNSFILRRFFRIAPLYYLLIFALLYFPLSNYQSIYINADNFYHLITHYLFVHSFFSSTVFSVISVAWSLSIEFIFYFFLIILIHSLNKFFSFKIKWLKYGLFIFILLLPLPFSIYVTKISTEIHILSLSSFYIGILLALTQFFMIEKKLSLTGVYTKIISVLIISALAFIFYRIQFDSNPENFMTKELAPSAFHLQIVKYLVIVSLLFALMMLISFFKDRIFYPIFSFYPLRFIGLVSYEMYLSHIFVFMYIKNINITFGPHLNAGVTFLLCLIVATLLHFVISRPFMAISRFSIKQHTKKPLWMTVLLILLALSLLIPLIHWIHLMDAQKNQQQFQQQLRKSQLIPQISTHKSSSFLESLFGDKSQVSKKQSLLEHGKIDFLHQLQIEKRASKNLWEITSLGKDPYFVIKQPFSSPAKSVLMQFAIKLPEQVFDKRKEKEQEKMVLQIFYTDVAHPEFSEQRSLFVIIDSETQGFFMEYLEFKNADKISAIRFDFGSKQATYALKGLWYIEK
jgi:peptidoglycan/LPS O-acetylase OafA/YrhL